MPIKPHFAKFLEGQAEALRKKCELGPFDRLDPFVLAQKMGMEVRFVGSEMGISSELLNEVLGEVGGSWDAGTLRLPDGRIHVYMNPNKLRERQHSTLMEEIAHIHLRHKPTEIVKCGSIVFRTCAKGNETQAYWLGATALLPGRILKGSRTLGKTTEQVASEHQVSADLVKFRCGMAGIKLP